MDPDAGSGAAGRGLRALPWEYSFQALTVQGRTKPGSLDSRTYLNILHLGRGTIRMRSLEVSTEIPSARQLRGSAKCFARLGTGCVVHHREAGRHGRARCTGTSES